MKFDNIVVELDTNNLKVKCNIKTYDTISKDYIITQMDKRKAEIQSMLQLEVNKHVPEQKCNVNGLTTPVPKKIDGQGDGKFVQLHLT